MAAPTHIIGGILIVLGAWPVSPTSGDALEQLDPMRSDHSVDQEWAHPLCEGEPPELINKDDQAFEYELLCGQKTERGTIAAHSKQSLTKKSGCALKLADNEATKLHADMVCTIEGAKLTCDLL